MANVSVSNTTGLYIGGGSTSVLTNAQTLLSLLSNNGGVTFSLDPAYSNLKVEAFGNYSNADVANFLTSYTGNLQAGNIVVINGIATGGNVSASYFIGNGSQLTGLPATYGNANVAAFLPTYTGNLVSLTGNVITASNVTAYSLMTTGTGGNISGANYVFSNYFIGNGSFLTSLTGANVSGTVGLATYVTGNAQANITSVGTLTSLAVTGNVTSSANVSGVYLLGNGAFITGLPTSSNYGNANVASYLASNSAVTILTTANVTTAANVAGNYILGNAAFMTGIPTGNYSNVNVAAYLPTYTGNMVSMTGNVITSANVTAAYHIGNGSALTNITGANITGNVGLAQFVTGNAQANITSVGTLTSLTVTGNISSSANISAGNLVTTGGSVINSNVSTGNLNISGTGVVYTPTVQATGSGGMAIKNASGTTQFTVGGGGGNNVTFSVATNINPANSTVVISPTGTGTTTISPGTAGSMNNMVIGNVTPLAANVTTLGASGNVTASYFIGNGSALTGITGNYSNVNVAAFLPTYTGNISASSIQTTGGITAGAGLLANAAFVDPYSDGIVVDYITGNGRVSVGSADGINFYNGGIANTLLAQMTAASGTQNGSFIAQGNIQNMAGSQAVTTLGNLSTLGGNVYVGFDNTLFNATTTASGSAGFAAQAPIRIGAQYTVTGNASVQLGMLFAPNVALGRPNTNNNARVKPMQLSGTFDANGNASTIGLSPFSDGGNQTNLVVGLTRQPSNTFNFALYNSQGPSGTAVTVNQASAQNSLISLGQTSANLTLTYAVGISSAIVVSGNTNQITNATAFRADFGQTLSNAALIGNRLALECIDPTANIKIAGNIVSTAGNIVTAGATITGRANITGNVGLGGVTSLTGYTETVAAASYTSGNVFSPNVQGTTIQTLTLNQNTTINQFTDALPGQSCTLILTQDGSGNRLLTSNMKFAGNSKTLSTAPGAIDIMSVLYDGTTYYASLTTGYA